MPKPMSDRELHLRAVAVVALLVAAGLAKWWHLGFLATFFAGYAVGLALLTALRLYLGRKK